MTTPTSKTLEVDPDTHQLIGLLAHAWDTTPNDVIRRLLAQLGQASVGQAPALPVTTRPAPVVTHPTSFVAVHAIYAGVRVDAVYDPVTTSTTIPEGPGAGAYTTPSGATTAVLQSLRPQVAPNRTGWNFWRITASGEHLSVLRPQVTHASASPAPASAAPPSAIGSRRR
ncbi:hypothetical protein AB0D14_32850 [Streptomyces sp. NPDC048484]|uniref:hypothetical protein n=1 Tax=Streptomyces sp. NPDC048484 TaxID=3155146 RepID=UPI00343A6DBE